MNRRVQSALRWLPAIIAIVIFLTHGLGLYTSSGYDDSHITYAEATNLAQGLGFTNINGERAEQSSSILHVIILGALKVLLPNTNISVIGSVLAILIGATCLVLLALPTKIKDPVVATGSAVIASLSTYFVYWAFGALESTLAALIVTSAFALHTHNFRPKLFAAILSLYVLVRPEGFYVIVLFCIGSLASATLIRLRKSVMPAELIQAALYSLALSFVIFSAITAFRLWYFGRIFPLPVYAKLGGPSLTSIENGFIYITKHFEGSIVFEFLTLISVLAAVVHIVRSTTADSRTILAGMFMLSILSFIVVSGGDWMAGGRFLVPIIPLAIYFGCMAIRAWSRVALLILLLPMSAISVVQSLNFRDNYSTGQALPSQDQMSQFSWFELNNQVHLRDVLFLSHVEQVVGNLITERGSIVIASHQAGMVPFYLRERFGDRLHFIDLHALATDDFLKCPLTSNVSKSSFGLTIRYTQYLELIDQLKAMCGLSKPDIIFDLGDSQDDEIKAITAHGYRVAYEQTGLVPRRSGAPVSLSQIMLISIP